MTENGAPQGVVVCGVDGSSGSRRALQEAIRTAMRREDRLRAVAVYEPRCPTRTCCGRRSSREAVVDVADQRAAPVVVAGRADRGALARWLLGSVAHGAVLRALRPAVVPDEGMPGRSDETQGAEMTDAITAAELPALSALDIESLPVNPEALRKRAARRARERVEVRTGIDGGDEVSIEARAVAVAAP